MAGEGVAQKPPWLKVKAPRPDLFGKVRGIVSAHGLRTVCDASQCPNISECWSNRTATFMILGDLCTRKCAFCAVSQGDPEGRLDPTEPRRVAEAVSGLELGHAVITSVTRDDLRDGGSAQFAGTIAEVRSANPRTAVELLVPDFQGNEEALQTISASRPDVIGHNIETVRRLQRKARDRRASYDLSLNVLERFRELDPQVRLKSSLMLGLGETREEVLETMTDLRKAGVDMITLGQYLKPRGGGLEVVRYVSPEEFDGLRADALGLGFARVASGPFVRSSYRAFEFLSGEVGGE